MDINYQGARKIKNCKSAAEGTGETVSQEGRAGRHWTKESHLPLSGDQKQLAVGRRQEQPVTVAERAASVLHTQHTTPRMASTNIFQYSFFILEI